MEWVGKLDKVAHMCLWEVDNMAKMLEEDKVHQFLLGLDDESFYTIQIQILALEPLSSLDKIFNMGQQEENNKRAMLLTLEAESRGLLLL